MGGMIFKNIQNKQVTDAKKQVMDYLQYAYDEAACAGFMFAMMYLTIISISFSLGYNDFLTVPESETKIVVTILGMLFC